tara:strand:+ start:426 stop:641 length:216 start_codon:yes stop_codon:yes gene_type:complete
MRYLTSINKDNPKRAEQDGRYRREYSNKTYSNTRAQKSNRATATTDRKVVAISDRIERADEQRNNRRRARA